MKTIFVFLTTGFEEIEALATTDILRRAGLDVRTVSLTGQQVVSGSHGIPVTADILFDQLNPDDIEMLVIPGGTPAFNDHAELKNLIQNFYDRGGKIAAICASPMVFGTMGLLNGRKATCYPGFEKYLEGAEVIAGQAVVTDGNITTGRGPGLTIDFALTLVEILAGRETRDNVAAQLLVK